MRLRVRTGVSRALLAAVLCASAVAHAERRTAASAPSDALALVQRPFGEGAHAAKGGATGAPREALAEGATDPAVSETANAPLEHRVRQGETLSAIAVRYAVTLDQLLSLNPGLDPQRLRADQVIAIDRDRTRVRYAMQPGDTLTRVAELHGVSVAALRRENPGIDPDRVRAGQELVIDANQPAEPASRSESVGSPASGQLVRARRLPPGPGYTVRTPERAWGTDEAVRGVVSGFANARRRHPRAPRLAVHDLSLRRGGPIDEHRSHQSGRDVDIAYPHARCARGVCDFDRIDPHELDAELAWTLLHYWLERDLLEAVFIDYRLQAPLYREARARGASAEQLARWFQYPRGRGEPLGVIRHFPKHADHMHVRFGCDTTDPECKSFRPLLMHATSR